MKKLLSVSLLILCLSFPVFGGHTTQGNVFCECTPVQSVCPCCGGGDLLTVANDQENDSINQNASDGAELTLELSAIRMAFLMWLKTRA